MLLERTEEEEEKNKQKNTHSAEEMKTKKKEAGLLFWKKKCLEVRFERVQRGFLSERKGKVIPCRGAEGGEEEEEEDRANRES